MNLLRKIVICQFLEIDRLNKNGIRSYKCINLTKALDEKSRPRMHRLRWGAIPRAVEAVVHYTPRVKSGWIRKL